MNEKLKKIVKKEIENALTERFLSAYDVLLENPDNMEIVKKEVIKKVLEETKYSAKEIVEIIEDLIKRDKEIIKDIKMTKLYGGIR